MSSIRFSFTAILFAIFHGSSFAGGPNLDSLIVEINFNSLLTAIFAVTSVICGLYVFIRSSYLLLRLIRGRDEYSDFFQGWTKEEISDFISDYEYDQYRYTNRE